MINENKHSKFVYAILALIPLTIFLAMCVLQSIDKEYSEASNVSGKNVLVTELQRGTENNSQERPLYGKGSEACQKYDCARIWEQWEENGNPVFRRDISKGKGQRCEVRFDETKGVYLYVDDGTRIQITYKGGSLFNPIETVWMSLDPERENLFIKTCGPYLLGLPVVGKNLVFQTL